MNERDKLLYLSTHDIWKKIKSNQDLLEDLINAYYSQIAKYDRKINALTLVNEKANLTNGGGLLQGMPVLIKDLFETEGLLTVAGSLEYEDYIPKQNADIVDQIIKSGGNILGKTNTPEFGMNYQTFNIINGITNNPFDLKRTVGGSSGGSAAAVLMQYAPFAIGSDIGGSLRQPASFCGIYSLRPTQGVMSDHGHLPPMVSGIVNRLATFGPMAKDLFGLKLLWYSIIGKDEMVWKESNNETISIKAYSSIEGAKIDPRVKVLMNSIFDKWEQMGHKVNRSTEYPNFDKTQSAYMGLLHNFTAQDNKNENELNYYVNLQVDVKIQHLEIMDGFDVWVIPVTSILPFNHNLMNKNFIITEKGYIINDDYNSSRNRLNYWVANGMYSWPISVSGFPTITLPIGMIEGLPVGVQVIGRPNEEEKLFEFTQILDINLGKRISQPSIS